MTKKIFGILVMVVFLFSAAGVVNAQLIQCALVQVNEQTTPEGYVFYFAAHFVVPQGYDFPKNKEEFPSSAYNFIMQEAMQTKLRELKKDKSSAYMQIVDVRFHYLVKTVPQQAPPPKKEPK
jgi:hypothetical protein